MGSFDEVVTYGMHPFYSRVAVGAIGIAWNGLSHAVEASTHVTADGL